MLEDALRRVFSRRVEDPLAVGDPATRAIRRARAARRRRAMAGLAAGGAAAVLFTGSLVYVQDWRVSRDAPAEFGLTGGEPPDPVVTTAAPPRTAAAAVVIPQQVDPPLPMGVAAQVDLYVAGRLFTASGERLSIPDGVDPARVYRVPVGWIIGGDKATRLLRDDGTDIPLPLTGHWVVSVDGARVAYPDGPSTIRYGQLGRDGVTLVSSAAVAAGTVPVTFAGDRLVLALRGPDGLTRQIDHWPLGAPYRPTWTVEPVEVYEQPGDEIVAQRVDRITATACLVRLDAAAGGLRVESDAACGLGLSAASTISPDGRWLATPVGSVVSLYDLATAFEQPIPAAVCSVPGGSTVVWEDGGTLLAGNGHSAVRCRPDGRAEQVPLPDHLPDGWRLVPVRTGD